MADWKFFGLEKMQKNRKSRKIKNAFAHWVSDTIRLWCTKRKLIQGFITPQNVMTMGVVFGQLWTCFWKKLSCGFENFKNGQNFDGSTATWLQKFLQLNFSKTFFRYSLAPKNLLRYSGGFYRQNWNFGQKLPKLPKKVPQLNFWHSPLGAVVQKFLHEPKKK